LTDIDKKYENQPVIKANVLRNAVRMTNPVTQEECLWIPTMSLARTQEDIREEQNRRALESETKVKRAKVKKATTPKPPTDPSQDGEAPMVPIGEPQMKRLAACISKMQELHMHMNGTLLDANLSEVKENIPPKTLEKAEAKQSALVKLMQEAEQKHEEKAAAKGAMKVLFEAVKACLSEGKDVNEKLKGLVEDAKAD